MKSAHLDSKCFSYHFVARIHCKLVITLNHTTCSRWNTAQRSKENVVFYGCFMPIQQFWTEKQIMSKLSIESFKPNCENKYSEWKICCGAHIFKGNRKGGSNNVHMVVIKLWRKSWQTEKTKAREAMTGHFTEANLWVHINFKLVSWLMISEVRPCLA